MAKKRFDARSWAQKYADSYVETDPGVEAIYYLPKGAPEREIRLLEVNRLMPIREADPVEPIDFGSEAGGPDAHRLLVVDVSPEQWRKIQKQQIKIPSGWSLADAIPLTRN